MNKPLRILIVDDDPDILDGTARLLKKSGYLVDTAADGEAALRMVDEHHPGLLLLDLDLPGINGLEVCRRIKGDPDLADILVVIVSASHTDSEQQAEGLEAGADGYIGRPIHNRELLARVGAFVRIRQSAAPAPIRIASLPSSTPTVFVGRGAAAEAIRQQITLIAGSGIRTVLVAGETGTGKEVVAALLHRLRYGPHAPFVAVNCPALSESLAESELFGHVQGSFTGATESRPGAFRRADGGLLLLDEVADLSNAVQAKLLRSLETWRIQAVGSSFEQPVNITVVTACNRPPETLVAEGRLRLDLFHRLNGIEITLPPLRQRLDDLPDLATHLLERLAAEAGSRPTPITPAALARLGEHGWPGNIRELRACLHRAVLFAGGDAITPAHLRFSTVNRVPETPLGTAQPAPAGTAAAPPRNEREEILAVLQTCRWNRTVAARRLGISYDVLRRRIKRYALHEG